jgi:hypothetical protein
MLCMGLVLAQQEGGINKRLRFRRPRPQLTDIANPEGDEAGPPIPLRRVPAGTPSFLKKQQRVDFIKVGKQAKRLTHSKMCPKLVLDAKMPSIKH